MTGIRVIQVVRRSEQKQMGCARSVLVVFELLHPHSGHNKPPLDSNSFHTKKGKIHHYLSNSGNSDISVVLTKVFKTHLIFKIIFFFNILRKYLDWKALTHYTFHIKLKVLVLKHRSISQRKDNAMILCATFFLDKGRYLPS